MADIITAIRSQTWVVHTRGTVIQRVFSHDVYPCAQLTSPRTAYRRRSEIARRAEQRFRRAR